MNFHEKRREERLPLEPIGDTRITGIRLKFCHEKQISEVIKEHYITSLLDVSSRGFGGIISSYIEPGTSLLVTIEMKDEEWLFIPAVIKNCDHFASHKGGYRFGASIERTVNDADLVTLFKSFELLENQKIEETVEEVLSDKA